jgi:DeoR/GlpR family transcriptional regulator of sugar metabolism
MEQELSEWHRATIPDLGAIMTLSGDSQTERLGPMLGQRERQARIRNRVITEGFVRAEQLADEFAVTLMTIHRDLDLLQQQGWLRKVRGGATAQPSSLFHGDLHYRLQDMKIEKETLAQTALKLIKTGQSIMLDESTTALTLARLLSARAPLTVISHFFAVLKSLAGEPGIDLISLGGSYYPAYDACLGLLTSESLRTLHADLLFMSTTAITEGFCYHQSQETIQVKRALMNAATRRILLVDHTKFRKRSLFQLAPVTSFDLVLVDSAVSAHDVTEMRDLGATVHVAGTEDAEGNELLAQFNQVQS